MSENIYRLTLSCADKPGLVAAVTKLLADNGGNILEAQQFNDPMAQMFFMRVVFDIDPQVIGAVRDTFSSLASGYGMTWKIRNATRPRRVAIMVSKFDHCLADLLYRQRIGELNMDVTAIISNHPEEALSLPVWGDIPFHHLPIEKGRKAEQEAKVRDIIDRSDAELVILARYMQILSDEMASYLSGRCINIHHSFLPGFKGAKPYHQAYARGVKMIGATAHYVTGDLDEGPIIHQDAEAISHSDMPFDLVRKGRDIERRVLARAVDYHLRDRVLMNGPDRTVVFTD